jgi:hypothetical protein
MCMAGRGGGENDVVRGSMDAQSAGKWAGDGQREWAASACVCEEESRRAGRGREEKEEARQVLGRPDSWESEVDVLPGAVKNRRNPLVVLEQAVCLARLV